MEYFSHDYNAREDEKIQKLIYKHGWQSYGLYWALVEMLYQNDGFIEPECDRIAYALHTDKDLIKSIIYDFNLFIEHGKRITSKSVLHRLKQRKGKSEKARQAATIRWDKEKAKDADAMQTHSERNAIKESKAKEIKEKENKENIPFETFWNLYDKKVGYIEKVKAKWNKLKDSERQDIINYLPMYIKATPDKQYRKNPETFLNNKSWNDEIPSEYGEDGFNKDGIDKDGYRRNGQHYLTGGVREI